MRLKGDPSQIAANLAAYSRQAQPKDNLAGPLKQWKDLAAKNLSSDRRPCGNLILLSSVTSQLKEP
jgi:hypothetical protein